MPACVERGMHRHWSLLSLFLTGFRLIAQDPVTELVQDEHHIAGEMGEDPDPGLHAYDRLNPLMGGDSLRRCSGSPCNGWVDDHYADGVLKHRGSYVQGRLQMYRNYHPGGALEREFRPTDNIRGTMRTYHPNGNLRSMEKYLDGSVIVYEDYYTNGQLRYAEERDRKQGYFIRMDLFSSTGQPLSLFQLVDRKALEFEVKEFHPGGALKSLGRSKYDPARGEAVHIGTWKYFAEDGSLNREEVLQDGRVVSVR